MSGDLIRDLSWKTDLKVIPHDLPNLVHTDSRSIEKGHWFVPIVGERFDGHGFISEALSKGAQGFLYARAHREQVDPQLRSRGIEVEDTTKALQDLGKWWRERHKSCRLAGITGSSGKTSVKELTFAMLQKIGPSLKTEGSLNNELGVPLTLCRLKPEHRFGVIEMGARHKGDVAFLGRMVGQDVGVLVNVGTAHIGEFGGADKILEAKMEISSAPNCVFFRDDERIFHSMKSLTGKRLVSFGRHQDSDVKIIDENLDTDGRLHIRVNFLGKIEKITLPYYHHAHALNVACVLAIGASLDLDLDACLPGLQNFRGVRGRFQVHEAGQMTVIDDSYNANPQSMRAGLETVSRAYPARKKVLILGDMKELGELSESSHREIGAFVAREVKPFRLVTVGLMGEWIGAGARDSGLASERLSSFGDVDSLLATLPEICKDAQLLYVKASNSLKLSKIIEKILSK